MRRPEVASACRARSRRGRPGATGIRERLIVLPDDTVVHTGPGDDTNIGEERAGVLAEG